MEIKVQTIQITEERSEKSVLALMRRSIPSQFEYILKHDDVVTRFTSPTVGPILPLIAFDKIKNLNLLPEGLNDFLIILHETDELYSVTKVKSGLIAHIGLFLKDAYLGENLADTFVVFEEGISGYRSKKSIHIEKITKADIDQSKHKFGEKRISLPIKKTMAVIGSILSIGVFAAQFVFDEPSKTEEVQQVKPIKKIRMDRYYDYKKSLVNRVQYSEMVNEIIAATLLNNKLPEGWMVEEVEANATGVQATIINVGGRTGTLKHFRHESGYTDFIDIDGQAAQFFAPIERRNWFHWTNVTDDFENIRDDFMDQMLIMGAKLRSNSANHNSHFSLQAWEVSLENTPVAYLDILKSTLLNKPIFIDHVRIGMLGNNNDGNVNITLQATIIGR